jgi:hypothetical protein
MAKLKINDLPKNMIVSPDQLKKIKGGLAVSGTFSSVQTATQLTSAKLNPAYLQRLGGILSH